MKQQKVSLFKKLQQIQKQNVVKEKHFQMQLNRLNKQKLKNLQHLQKLQHLQNKNNLILKRKNEEILFFQKKIKLFMGKQTNVEQMRTWKTQQVKEENPTNKNQPYTSQNTTTTTTTIPKKITKKAKMHLIFEKYFEIFYE